MKIYLDIDGTMIHEDLTENYSKPAQGLEEFLIALRPYDTYWLTTHCMDGDPLNAQQKMKAVVPISLFNDIDRIKPTTWKSMKTEALDWSGDFIWFDNDIFREEWDRFETATPNQQVVEVDLLKNPEQLIEITNEILKDVYSLKKH